MSGLALLLASLLVYGARGACGPELGRLLNSMVPSEEGPMIADAIAANLPLRSGIAVYGEGNRTAAKVRVYGVESAAELAEIRSFAERLQTEQPTTLVFYSETSQSLNQTVVVRTRSDADIPFGTPLSGGR